MTATPSLFTDAGLLARAIADATDDAIFAKDSEGRYQYANPAALAAIGRRAEDLLGRRDDEVQADAAFALRAMAQDRRVLECGEGADFEQALMRPDGTVRHWHVRKMPLRDAAGSIVGLLGIGRDVTQRKIDEAQREATRLMLEMGVQAAGLVMAEIDYRTNLNHISAELARLLELGDGPTVVPRQAIFDRVHPDDRARYLEGIARTLDPGGNGHLAIDVRALLPSGEVRWLHIRLQIVFALVDGVLQPERGICAARDVTTEMLAQRQLRAAQRLAQSVIEGAGALVYAKDLQGRYILSNQAWRSLHGLSAEQAKGVTDADIFGAEAAALLAENDRKVLATGEPLLAQERVLLAGQPVTFRSSRFPLYDESGLAFAVCGVSTDITDVVEADRRKDEFIATLAHELRNPLAPIRTGLEILRRVGGLPPAAARTRDMMERQMTHMVRLVDDLLDVSRVSRGKLELRLQALTLDQVVAEAIDTCEPAIRAARHTLAVELPSAPVPLKGDLTRLAQVFSNLVSNAVRYTPAGGRITVRAHVASEEAVIEVADNGNGIAADVLPDIFGLFAQGHGPHHGDQSGLGIGLWLVKRLVELHGGAIVAHSPGPGAGAIFTVRLPLVP
ncbi:PAS domain-containing protein [Ramlibacter sp.]|uniref:PAS domain-containing sensor histidine kinase n=1 Tax=Ramlibacter sp. TaxID=1917967 RepID=UPI00261A243D|nr:PAS domain-containing protein [Ramlibacter sp.]MDB5956900.1 putative histidine kinase, hybrid [Ramlibacter sp.]